MKILTVCLTKFTNHLKVDNIYSIFLKCKKMLYICVSYKKKSPKMSTLLVRHCNKTNIAPDNVVMTKLQQFRAFFGIDGNFLVNWKIIQRFIRSISDYWNYSFIDINEKLQGNWVLY